MTMTHPDEQQIGGDHYSSKEVQPWQAMGAWMSKEAFAGFLHGNCIKYLARYKDKSGVEDLKKCQHYLAKLIAVETVELVSDNLNVAGKNMRKSYFEAGRQSALNGTEINNAFRATMNRDWLEGYDQVKAESVDDRHDD
jgi:hypothetical protein